MRRKLRKKVTYPSEAALCEAVMATARAAGYVVHPETCGWDFVLARDDGFQVGVQAKLRPNVAVLAQALRGEGQASPDVRAVLVPDSNSDFSDVARKLGLLVLEGRRYDPAHDVILVALRHCPWKATSQTWMRAATSGDNPELGLEEAATERCASALQAAILRAQAHFSPKGRLRLPPKPANLPAGVPAPRQVTEWRVKAVALCARLREVGHLTRKDFAEAGVSITTWLNGSRGEPAWLLRVEGTRPSLYIANPDATLPDVGFEELAA